MGRQDGLRGKVWRIYIQTQEKGVTGNREKAQFTGSGTGEAVITLHRQQSSSISLLKLVQKPITQVSLTKKNELKDPETREVVEKYRMVSFSAAAGSIRFAGKIAQDLAGGNLRKKSSWSLTPG